MCLFDVGSFEVLETVTSFTYIFATCLTYGVHHWIFLGIEVGVGWIVFLFYVLLIRWMILFIYFLVAPVGEGFFFPLQNYFSPLDFFGESRKGFFLLFRWVKCFLVSMVFCFFFFFPHKNFHAPPPDIKWWTPNVSLSSNANHFFFGGGAGGRGNISYP